MDDNKSNLILPNGGMTEDELANFIKANPGQVANIGFNPNNPGNSVADDQGDDVEPPAAGSNSDADDSNDEEDSTEDNDSSSQSRSPAAILAKLQDLKKNPTQNPPPLKNVLSTLLGTNDQGIAAAQQAQNNNSLLSLLGQAGSTVGQALAPLAPKQDYSAFWNALQKQGEQPVANVLTRQAAKQSDLRNNMLEEESKTLEKQNDPNSAASKVMRDLYEKETGQKADPNLTYAEIAKFEPALARMAITKQALGARQDALLAKSGEKQDKVAQDVGKQFESSRQLPDVKQALIDKYNASKALLILNKSDLNKISPEMTKLVTAEVAKIAQGGVPTMTELQALTPGSLPQWFARSAQKLVNEPTPANAGAFLKQYKDYLEDLKSNANELVKQRFVRPLEVNKKALGDENYNRLVDTYIKPLEEQNSKLENNSQNNNYGEDVLNYAKAHNITPEQAQQIKNQRTGQ